MVGVLPPGGRGLPPPGRYPGPESILHGTG